MNGAIPKMVWSRWTSRTRDDRRWHTERIDTTDRTIPQATTDVIDRITRTRAERHQGRLPLAQGWKQG